ncbi:MAG: anaerobic ribonucleoside-triphosphate reductase activating protein [Treponema sp.]|nr:anaerobic ribonucleoside-triphosphate reductase activating protein [Treponema sp.]
MADLALNEPAGVLVKTTLVDFPGRVAGSFFLKGCNLRCPYCYNTGLVLNNEPIENLNTLDELFSHLEKRQGILSGLVISGGEPLLNPNTYAIIKKGKELGYKIKLDTNGTFPDKLQNLLNDEQLRPDFVALDVKTAPERYSELLANKNSNISKELYTEAILKSINIVSSLAADSREYRTVLVPALVGIKEIEIIGKLLPSDASWQFAQFRNENCLDAEFNKISPYTDSEIKELVDFAKSMIKGAELR